MTDLEKELVRLYRVYFGLSEGARRALGLEMATKKKKLGALPTKKEGKKKMAGKTVEEAGKKTHVVEVVKYGDKLMLPEGMSISDAIKVLRDRAEYETKTTIISATFDAFPWDGALALHTVLERKFGWASMQATYDWFGEHPPHMIEVEVAPGLTKRVPWGRLVLFKEEGYIDTSIAKQGSRIVFSASATIQRKHEDFVGKIFEEVRQELREHSIYRGQAVSLRFRDDKEKALEIPTLKIMNTTIAVGDLIFSDDVHDAVETNLFTPITRMADCRKVGIPIKRGVLLAGEFGVGKTLAAKKAAELAVKHSVTFIYCKHANEFAESVEFAQQYAPAVVFCEDIDSVISGERDVEMNDILNIVDGIDSKGSEIIVVLTTNAVEKINIAVLRPGRLDAVIEVKKPDAKAVEKLIRYYGRGFLAPDANLVRAGAKLAGNIPAVIEEVVKRSKLAALKRSVPGNPAILVGEADITEAAETMRMQLDLLSGKKEPSKYTPGVLLTSVAKFVEAVEEERGKQNGEAKATAASAD